MKKVAILLLVIISFSSSIYSTVTNITADITTNTSWSGGTYFITKNIKVDTGDTLTITSGTIVKFENNTRLWIDGVLIATGFNDDAKVFFTSKNDDTVGEGITTSSHSPNKGDWNGIYLYGSYDPEGYGYFTYCEIRYGGGTGVSNPANVSNYGGYGYFKHSVSTESASYGYRHIPYATTIENSTFTSNANAGILYECTDNANIPNISNNEFVSNGSYAAIFLGSTLPVFTNNSGTFNNINKISVRGTVRASQTWSTASNLPIIIVGSFVSVSHDATLTFSSGILDFGEEYIIGDGDFSVGSGATLVITSPEGIVLSDRHGNIRNGSRTYDPGANYIFNASSTQVTGDNFPLNANNITFNNASGVTLTNSVTVSGTLDLTSGTVTTNSNIITLGTSTSNLGTLIANGKIEGNFQRWFATSTVTNVEFPLETSGNDRKVNISYTTAPTTGGMLLAKFVASNPGTNGLPVSEDGKTISECLTTGYWEVTANNGLSGGSYSLDLTADGFAGITDYTKLRMVKRANSSSDWAFTGTHSATTGSNATPILHRTGLSSFSNMAIGEVNETTPVELISFIAKRVGENIILNWQTATEINNYGFEVQRSVGSGQTSEFVTIAFIEGHGNSNSLNDYSFMDTSTPLTTDVLVAERGVVFNYRLKQLDVNGDFEYSDIVSVELRKSGKFKLSQNYPNPFNPSTIIKYEIGKVGFVTLKIYNLLGEEVATLVNKNQNAGSYEVKFDASSLTSGMYLYKIHSSDFSESKKMLLIK